MPDNLTDKKVLIVGAGPMAADYAAVLNDAGILFDVVGRGEASAQQFRKKTGTMPSVGGLDKFIAENDFNGYTHGIVATGIESLAGNAVALLNGGLKKLLVEKPGSLYLGEIENLKTVVELQNASISIAYNRRFYASVAIAKEIVEADGGITSFHFDFTEWSHKIEPLAKAPGVKEAWLLANSSHVIDLAFHLGGFPETMHCHTGGSLSWHQYSIFSGSGITESGALFNYGANWESAGRWGIELMTKAHKVILRPMEQLFVQDRGSIEVKRAQFDMSLDTRYKPGLYLQTLAFLKDDLTLLPSIQEQYQTFREVYLRIMGAK